MLTVSEAEFANCNGEYRVTEDRVAWAKDRPVYANLEKDRYKCQKECPHSNAMLMPS